jgi:hypothetical protein
MTPSRRNKLKEATSDADVVRDADGLVVDEYSDENFRGDDNVDALDQPGALDGSAMLAAVPDGGEGIIEIDPSLLDGHDADTADMGLGAEPRSAEELEDAAIGHALKGAAGVTRDDEVHGARMFDSPDGKGRQIPDGEQD